MIQIRYLGKYFTDFLSLIKVEDNWVIINKRFHHQ
ncbi:nuclear transport factor 2 family protein [Thermodesulfobacteriota bacterium]